MGTLNPEKDSLLGQTVPIQKPISIFEITGFLSRTLYKCSAHVRAAVLELFREKGVEITKTGDWTKAIQGSYADIITELVRFGLEKK